MTGIATRGSGHRAVCLPRTATREGTRPLCGKCSAIAQATVMQRKCTESVVRHVSQGNPVAGLVGYDQPAEFRAANSVCEPQRIGVTAAYFTRGLPLSARHQSADRPPGRPSKRKLTLAYRCEEQRFCGQGARSGALYSVAVSVPRVMVNAYRVQRVGAVESAESRSQISLRRRNQGVNGGL